MASKKLSATIWEEEGSYVSRCPELEVASFGETPEDGLENLKEAVELYLENAEELVFPSRKKADKNRFGPGAAYPRISCRLKRCGPSFPSKFPAEILTTPGTLQATSMTAPIIQPSKM